MKISAKEYIKIGHKFSLGHLTTEGFHPKSKSLSSLVQKDLSRAIVTLKEIDDDALDILKNYSDEIYHLSLRVQETLASGNRVFISGCGATGRLALGLEKIYREEFDTDQVVGFMAGGDYALIKSVESFEDNFEYGEKQLMDLGFTENDLLLAVTEGGETSFVIGTVRQALKVSKQSPFFVYCNPDSELESIERSDNLIKNPEVLKLNLTVGPMAISGSTRMQATTVQKLAIGYAIFHPCENREEFCYKFSHYIEDLKSIEIDFLKEFIEYEASFYKQNGHITYESDAKIGLCILTDTTERSPTFNLASFESTPVCEPSLSYLSVRSQNNPEAAWKALLHRKPRCLTWEDLPVEIDLKTLYQFDISRNAISRRESNLNHKVFKIFDHHDGLSFYLDDLSKTVHLMRKDLLFKYMGLKIILNIHSTLVMGLLGRYEGNMMTFVKPSNYKLINRSVRYVQNLLKEKNISIHENKIIEYVLEVDNNSEGPKVLQVYNKILKVIGKD